MDGQLYCYFPILWFPYTLISLYFDYPTLWFLYSNFPRLWFPYTYIGDFHISSDMVGIISLSPPPSPVGIGFNSNFQSQTLPSDHENLLISVKVHSLLKHCCAWPSFYENKVHHLMLRLRNLQEKLKNTFISLESIQTKYNCICITRSK